MRTVDVEDRLAQVVPAYDGIRRSTSHACMVHCTVYVAHAMFMSVCVGDLGLGELV